MDWTSRYINIPYVNKGREFSGADCWGLVRLVYLHELGIELPDYGEVSADDLSKVHRKVEDVQEQWEAVAHNDIQAFDICVMRAPGKRIICHVGVVVDKNRILHVEKRTDSVIVPLNDPIIRERVSCFRRHKATM